MFVKYLPCRNWHKEINIILEKLGIMSRTGIRTQLAWLQSPTFNHYAMLYLKTVTNIYGKHAIGQHIILSPLSQVSLTQ